jgi:hypothetical protein
MRHAGLCYASSGHICKLCIYITNYVVPDSSVGIATRYGPDGPGSESRWRRDFCAGPGAHPASYTMDTGSFPGGGGESGRGVGLTNLSRLSAQVKERVELYLNSTSGPSWPCYRVNFTFTFTFLVHQLLLIFHVRPSNQPMTAGVALCPNEVAFPWYAQLRQ